MIGFIENNLGRPTSYSNLSRVTTSKDVDKSMNKTLPNIRPSTSLDINNRSYQQNRLNDSVSGKGYRSFTPRIESKPLSYSLPGSKLRASTAISGYKPTSEPIELVNNLDSDVNNFRRNLETDSMPSTEENSSLQNNDINFNYLNIQSDM